ncbi:Protein of unknown function [Sulfurivirga caldicuralii]|uniref:Inner membrane protein YgaP-like transmembrane domain-containing protein n=1 Tax=Sulfurivirga caldicuralii TaxID=364032 RepID=A0A1N6E1G7_9GAMM|nr:DUF2892 domain-containing protein [Sulfurivirga caldicuralii]SIN76831.1 Protein of unknown function [Sulfurivirga caldicuralii]
MTIERFVPIFAGSMILISLALAMWINSWWILLTAFVGLNLIISALTGFCPLVKILEKLGMKHGPSPFAPRQAQQEQ